MKTRLTRKEKRFVAEYFAHKMNGTRAAIAAGYSEKTAPQIAYEMLKKPHVALAVNSEVERLNEKAHLTSDEIMLALKRRAMADVRDIIELHRDCCRYCYGIGHLYQETPAENRRRRIEYEKELANPDNEGKAIMPFDPLGGVGYDPRKPPLDDCPECHGRGVETILAKDTRQFSENAKTIYEGVKTTANGMEIKIASRDAALDRLAKINGLYGKDEEASKNVTIVYNSPSHDNSVDDTRSGSDEAL